MTSLFALLIVFSPIAAAAGAPTATVVESLELPARMAEFRGQARAAVVAAVAERAGWRVADASPCVERSCLRPAESSGYVLRVAGRYIESGHYDLRVELWRGESRLDEASDPCLSCTGADMAARVGELAARLANEERGRAAPAAASAQPSVPPAPQPKTATTAPVLPDQHVQPTPVSSRRWLGWLLVGAGAAAALGGAAAFWADENDVACHAGSSEFEPCRRLRRTWVPAVGLSVAGAGALVAGTIILLRDRRDAAALSLSVSPSSFSLGGRF